LAWWRGYFSYFAIVVVILVILFALRPSGNLPVPVSLEAYSLQSLILALGLGGVAYGLVGAMGGRKKFEVVLLSMAVLLILTSVPAVHEHSGICADGDIVYSRPTTHLVSLWVYLGGDGGVVTDHGYVWATYGGMLPC
jgi:hypothetical protein